VHPWASSGHAYRALVKARHHLETEPVTGLNALQLARLQEELEKTLSASEELLAEVEKGPAMTGAGSLDLDEG
jgi:hypothetical protein